MLFLCKRLALALHPIDPNKSGFSAMLCTILHNDSEQIISFGSSALGVGQRKAMADYLHEIRPTPYIGK